MCSCPATWRSFLVYRKRTLPDFRIPATQVQMGTYLRSIIMAKKPSLKASLSSQQTRLARNSKVKEAAQKQEAIHKIKSKGKGKVPQRSIIPFRPEDKILLIGEGNFSFSLALFNHIALQALPPGNVTATSYDSESECVQKYPEAKVIIEELRSRGVEVVFNVDATALVKCKVLKGRKWNRIVWNFPHAGDGHYPKYRDTLLSLLLGKGITDQDRNILSNQLLLLGFLASAASLLKEGPTPLFSKQKERKGKGDSGLENEDGLPDETISEDDEVLQHSASSPSGGERGTILITLRNVHPYTEWSVSCPR